MAREAVDKFALTCLKGEMLHDLGSIAESRAAFSEALALAQDDSQRCRAWIGLAGCMRITDEYDEAYATLEKAEAAAAEYARGRMITAHDHFRRCIELCREHGFGRIEVANISMLGFSRYFHDPMKRGLEDGLAAVETARKVGHRRAELLGRMMCVYALTELGELDRVKAHSKEAQALVRRLGAMRFEAQNLTSLARIVTAEGRRSEAIELLEQALQISRDTDIAFTGPRALSSLALVTEDPERR